MFIQYSFLSNLKSHPIKTFLCFSFENIIHGLFVRTVHQSFQLVVLVKRNICEHFRNNNIYISCEVEWFYICQVWMARWVPVCPDVSRRVSPPVCGHRPQTETDWGESQLGQLQQAACRCSVYTLHGILHDTGNNIGQKYYDGPPSMYTSNLLSR